jgi:hypothetical protein
MVDAGDCERGWSDRMCFTSCADNPVMLHEAAGVIQVGGQPPHTSYFLPDEVCSFTILPLPASGPAAPGGGGQGQRTTVIRLQFEYGQPS